MFLLAFLIFQKSEKCFRRNFGTFGGVFFKNIFCLVRSKQQVFDFSSHIQIWTIPHLDRKIESIDF